MKSEEEAELELTADLVKHRQVFTPIPQQIQRLVNRVIARRGVTQIQGRDELIAAWQAVCDPQLVNHTQVLALRHKKLEVRVGHSLINQQLNFEKDRLLAALQEKLPQVNLQGLIFKTGPVNPSAS
jgi:hypothetical protein